MFCPWLEDEDDIEFTIVYLDSKRCGLLAIEWDYTNDRFVEGKIWAEYVLPQYRFKTPMRIALADVKDTCRFNTRMVGVYHRLNALIDLDDFHSIARFRAAGFMEISRDPLAILMVWPNDDHE